MSTEFWAAILGAIVGTISAGGVSAFLQKRESDRAQTEKDKAVAGRLLYKVMRMYAQIEGLVRRIMETEKCGPISWQILRFHGRQVPVYFDAEEMGLLLRASHNEFEKLTTLEGIHRAIIDYLDIYKSNRSTMINSLPKSMRFRIDHQYLTKIPEEDRESIALFEEELNDIAIKMVDFIKYGYETARATMEVYQKFVRPYLGLSLEFEGRLDLDLFEEASKAKSNRS